MRWLEFGFMPSCPHARVIGACKYAGPANVKHEIDACALARALES